MSEGIFDPDQITSAGQQRELNSLEQINADTTVNKLMIAYLMAQLASMFRAPPEAEKYMRNSKIEILSLVDSLKVEDQSTTLAMRKRMRESVENLLGAISFAQK
jgi:hypothetical protein